jgi:hypothetical protein
VDTLPGTSAEILDDNVRQMIARGRITTGEWTEVSPEFESSWGRIFFPLLFPLLVCERCTAGLGRGSS